MNRIKIWQCKDTCCKNNPHIQRHWRARSVPPRGFDQYQTVSASWSLALRHAEEYAGWAA